MIRQSWPGSAGHRPRCSSRRSPARSRPNVAPWMTTGTKIGTIIGRGDRPGDGRGRGRRRGHGLGLDQQGRAQQAGGRARDADDSTGSKTATVAQLRGAAARRSARASMDIANLPFGTSLLYGDQLASSGRDSRRWTRRSPRSNGGDSRRDSRARRRTSTASGPEGSARADGGPPERGPVPSAAILEPGPNARVPADKRSSPTSGPAHVAAYAAAHRAGPRPGVEKHDRDGGGHPTRPRSAGSTPTTRCWS